MPGTVIGISLNLGFAGKISRNPMNKIGSRFVKSILNGSGVETQPVIPFGSAAVLNADNSVSLWGATGSGVSAATLANFAGFAVAEVKQVMTFNFGSNSAASSYEPAVPADILEIGSMTTFIAETSALAAGGPVYIVTVAGSTYTVGQLATISVLGDGSTTIQLTNCKWTTGKVDANGIAEITILTQANP